MPNRNILAMLLLLAAFAGCTSGNVRPVDIYPEDMCAHCRMAVTDQRFAGEVITTEREVFKFDDLGCLEAFQEGHHGLRVKAVFVKEYTTKAWLEYDRAVIVTTAIPTPMGSGKIALPDSSAARQFLAMYGGQQERLNGKEE